MMEEIKTKVCTKCKKELPATLEYFYKYKRTKLGLSARCIKCNLFEANEYNIKNKEKIRKIKCNYWKENAEKLIKQNKKYREQNKEELSKKSKYYYRKNIKKIKERYKVQSVKNIGELKNSYVAKLLGISVKDCSPELIETKRLSIQIKRELGIGSGIKNKQLN